jgi:hypothetical protein
LGGEEEGSVGDLLSFSEEQGAAPNGDPRRQPWQWSSVTGNVYVRKRERPSQREGKKGGRRETGKEGFGGVLIRSRAVAGGGNGELGGVDTQQLVSQRRRQVTLQKGPRFSSGFFWNFKNSTLFNSFCCFAIFWKFQII